MRATSSEGGKDSCDARDDAGAAPATWWQNGPDAAVAPGNRKRRVLSDPCRVEWRCSIIVSNWQTNLMVSRQRAN
jgi:hypothetical protein